MSQQLSKSDLGMPQTGPTTPFSEPWLGALRNAIGTINGKPTLMSGWSITAEERSRIAGLIRHHRARMTPEVGDRRQIAVTLAKLLAAFPAQSQSEGPTEQRVEAYFEALGAVPAWAAEEARKAVLRGQAPECSTAWAPTPAQFAGVCQRMLEHDRRIVGDLTRIEEAEQIDGPAPDERERVIFRMAELREKLAVEAGDKPKDTPLAARLRFEEMCREAGVSPDSIRDQPEAMRRLKA